MTFDEIRCLLKKYADEKYKNFSESLMPGTGNILGIRIPLLRKIAKEIYKSGDYDDLIRNKSIKYQEETMLQGMLIGFMKEDPETVLYSVKEYIPKITNWALCDTFCQGLKFTKRYPEEVWKFIIPYSKSEKTYEKRFAYVMMLSYFINDEYIDKIFKTVDEFEHEDYYARMGIAWLISMCFVKYPDKTRDYLKKSRLDRFTYNKSIQKICESLKVDDSTKAEIKKLKREILSEKISG